MRVLVTGNRGYIGSVMAPLLRRRGHHVVGLDNCLFEACGFGPHQRVGETLTEDLRDVDLPELQGFDAVINLAGISNDPLASLRKKCTYDINHRASVRLARLAKAAGTKRFLHSSTCSVYGAAGEAWIDEADVPSPRTPYAESKLLAEQDIGRLADDDFSPVFLRSGTAYGVSPLLRGDLVVNNLTGYAFTTSRVLLKSDGLSWRPLVHVEDISLAFACALEAPRSAVHGSVLNVGASTENYRIRDVAEIVEGVVKGSRVEFADAATHDDRSYRVDCSRIQRVLRDFQPEWTVERGVRQLFDAYERFGLTREALESGQFIRVEHIVKLQNRGELDKDLRWVRDKAA